MDEHGCFGVGVDVGGGDAETSDTALGSNMGDEMVDPPLLTILISAQFQNLLIINDRERVRVGWTVGGMK